MAAYELFYWPGIQGRGEFVRLALEDAGAEYFDVARTRTGMSEMMKLLRPGGGASRIAPFAPPFLRSGDLVIAQTANILAWLAPRLDLVPRDDASRALALEIQLTIADAVAEAHETHHPIDVGKYYEDQKREAVKRAAGFTRARIPKFLGWLEGALASTGGPWLLGAAFSYADLSAFQLVEGLSYAFPNTMRRVSRSIPRLRELRTRVAERPRIAAYLVSDRRIPFNEDGIFRHYPALDSWPGAKKTRRRGRSGRKRP